MKRTYINLGREGIQTEKQKGHYGLDLWCDLVKINGREDESRDRHHKGKKRKGGV